LVQRLKKFLNELRDRLAPDADRRPPRELSTSLGSRRVFAIGDIHGRLDLLQILLDLIGDRCKADAEEPILIFLGDYVDRGPQSAQVLDRLIALHGEGRRTRFIGGNHEEAMGRFLDSPLEGLAWLDYGGRETVASYGLSAPDKDADSAEWLDFHKAFSRAVPKAHRRFLWGLEDAVELGDYLFVHAGVDPDRPLQSQSPHDLRWIRGKFLRNTRPLGKLIVHGHTPSNAPYADDVRLGIDTWAYKSGVLTAVELTGSARTFHQASLAP